jgi:hypothetical protein
MDMQINPQSDDDSKKQGTIRKRQQADPTIQIIVRTLICIAVIDLSIWGYFAFVKKVPLVTGLKEWQYSVHKAIGFDTKPKVITKTIVINQQQQKNYTKKVNQNNIKREITKTIHLNTEDEIHDIEIKNKYMGKQNDTMYSWKDEKGTIHYSNTGFPEGNIEKLWTRKIPQG